MLFFDITEFSFTIHRNHGEYAGREGFNGFLRLEILTCLSCRQILSMWDIAGEGNGSKVEKIMYVELQTAKKNSGKFSRLCLKDGLRNDALVG